MRSRITIDAVEVFTDRLWGGVMPLYDNDPGHAATYNHETQQAEYSNNRRAIAMLAVDVPMHKQVEECLKTLRSRGLIPFRATKAFREDDIFGVVVFGKPPGE